MREWRIFTFLVLSSLFSCRNSEVELRLFEDLDPSDTEVDFINELEYSESVNAYTYKSFYNGGGIGLGDFDNDGLIDIFFSGNMKSNRLFRNLGEFSFEDITESAGLKTENVWSTGVSVVDVNADGFLDIYVCKSGPPEGNERENSLYINNGDLTFTDRASEYGLDNKGLSVHAVFFDYDRDEDLDCYLLNNSIRSVGGYDFREAEREIPDSLGGNKFFENQEGYFIDKSAEVGIYRSEIGFGLGVTVSDINRDNWPDLFISNDFFERDYLYINNQSGGFDEVLENNLMELSMGSMGADMADINNDGFTELFVTEMLPERHDRLMSKTVFESWDKYQVAVDQGYHHQFSRNVFQLNNQNGSYSEISRLIGVDATDWSWGALIFDMDNDGFKDIFVANGIYKDLLDQDYINFMADPAEVRKTILEGGDAIKNLIDKIPSEALPNYFFANNGDLTFSNQNGVWSNDEPTYSNGSAYADLDNDGDLDMVLNNVNQPSQILKNNSEVINSQRSFLNIKLIGDGANIDAIGSKVLITNGQSTYYQELSPMRGFQSSVDYRLNFGLDTLKKVEELKVIWPDGNETVLADVSTNQFLTISKNKTSSRASKTAIKKFDQLFNEVDKAIKEAHIENNYVDFDRERLLIRMNSNEGPCICKGDVDNDGLADIFLGGARDSEGKILTQNKKGQFAVQQSFTNEATSEDVACSFFDADGDGDLDLYVGSGSSEFSEVSTALIDRLYFNDGNGSFIKSNQILPAGKFISTSTVVPWDYDDDGDLDLFVGARCIPGKYGLPASSFMLENDGTGSYSDKTYEWAPLLKDFGMVTDATLSDLNNDNELELIVISEWMPVSILQKREGTLANIGSELGVANKNGWFSALHVADINDDGFQDIIVGNQGLNTRLSASQEEPLKMFINDFDQNGTLDQITAMYFDGGLYPLVQLKELSMQLPSLKKEFLRFSAYKDVQITDLFDPEIFARSLELEIHDLSTIVYISNDEGRYDQVDLPIQAQFSPVFAIETFDANGDGHQDILMGGNMSKMKPEWGINSASFGMLFTGDGTGNFEYVNYTESGIFCKGEVRDIVTVETSSTPYIIFARNNDFPYVISPNAGN